MYAYENGISGFKSKIGNGNFGGPFGLEQQNEIKWKI